MLSRVVEVVRSGSAGPGRGSGYAVAADLVLTAAHVVAGDADVRVVASGRELPAIVAWRSEPLDAALVRVPARPWDGIETRWGVLTGVRRVPCIAIGYPRVQVCDGTRVEETVEGFVMPPTGRRIGRYGINITTALPYEGRRDASPWAGLSGAAVLTEDGDQVFGVITADPTGFQPSRLEALPVAALFEDPQFRDLVGADRGALARISGPSPSVPIELSVRAPRPPRVFIGASAGALQAYRLAAAEICQRLGLTAVRMEEFGPYAPVRLRRDSVRTSDVLLLFLGGGDGERPPDEERSYAELEHDWAVSAGTVDVLPFVIGDAEGDVGRFREDLILALHVYQPRVPPPDAEAPRPPRPPRRPARELRAEPAYIGNAPFTGRTEHLEVLDQWGRSADPIMVVESIGGTGKSALTWEWTTNRAPGAVRRLAGRFWWSFYDGSSSITKFLHSLLSFAGDRKPAEIALLTRTELLHDVIAVLRARPYLVVLDGFERLLNAYHRFDPSKLDDDEVEPTKRSLIEPFANELVRGLLTVGPTKVLISSRLLPEALESRSGLLLPGVRRLALPGLGDDEVALMLRRLHITGGGPAARRYFRRVGNHPLLVEVVAGLVLKYRPAPGDIERWLADPAAGGAGNVPGLSLVQRRTHILDTAFSGLDSAHRRLLGYISVLAGSVDWATLKGINPLRPAEPQDGGDERATVALVAALADLGDRGLLWWNRERNSYDLHPIVRAYAHDQLEDDDRRRANERVSQHFEALPPEDVGGATSVDDLLQTLTLFRALVGSQQPARAAWLWVRLEDPLYVRLGAHSIIVELLAPVARSGGHKLRGALASSYAAVGRFAEALDLAAENLDNNIKQLRLENLVGCLTALCNVYLATGQLVAVERCMRYLDRLAPKIEGHHGTIARIQAQIAIELGDLDRAGKLIRHARIAGADANDPFFGAAMRYLGLQLKLYQGRLGQPDLDEAAAAATTWRDRSYLADVTYEHARRQGDFATALTAAEDQERAALDAGEDFVPVRSALALARLGRAEEAAAAVEDTLVRLPRLHPAAQPCIPLAQALVTLGRPAEACEYARAAYRQAWCDGPPYARHWALHEARELLAALGIHPPPVRQVSPSSVRLPHESGLDKVLG